MEKPSDKKSEGFFVIFFASSMVERLTVNQGILVRIQGGEQN